MKYFVLKTHTSDGGLIEACPSPGPAEWKYDEGKSLARQYPRNASVRFSDNYPDARKLYDFQANILQAFIISSRTRKLLESLEVTNAEYLPVAIKDHKGNVVAEDYAFLNLLGGEDAIDLEKSKYEMGDLEKDQIAMIDKLVINPKGIRPEAKIFRCKMERRLVLIREDVHEAFVREKLTGFKVYEADGWDGMDI